MSAAKSILQNHTNLQLNHCTYVARAVGGKLKLRKVTTFLGIKESAAGRMVLSADQEIVEHLIHNYPVQEEEDIDVTIDKKLENVLSGYANEIFQQAIKSMPNQKDFLTSEALVSIMAEDASTKYPQSEIPINS